MASNRIEGIVAPPSRVRSLVNKRTDPRQPTIRRVLVEMKQAGVVKCLGTGRSAEWEKLPSAD